MKNRKLIWITYTAVLIALIVLAQLLTRVIPPVFIGPFHAQQLITGSLVNLVLVVGALVPGFSCAATAALLSPVFAALFGILPNGQPMMIPVIMAGNLVLVFVVWVFGRASNGLEPYAGVMLSILGVLAGAALKQYVLQNGTEKLVIPLLHLKDKPALMLTTAMTTPQLITAVVGGLLALLLMPALRSFKKGRR